MEFSITDCTLFLILSQTFKASFDYFAVNCLTYYPTFTPVDNQILFKKQPTKVFELINGKKSIQISYAGQFLRSLNIVLPMCLRVIIGQKFSLNHTTYTLAHKRLKIKLHVYIVISIRSCFPNVSLPLVGRVSCSKLEFEFGG